MKSMVLTVAALALMAGASECFAASAQEVAALKTYVAQLDAQAQRAQDVSDIKRLQRAYGFYVDQGHWNEVADLFADDGTAEYGLGGVYIGKERIRKYLIARAGGKIGVQEGRLDDHIILQPVVHVADDGLSAKARWRSLILNGQLGQYANWGEGTYENEYIKQNGMWKLKKLHWYRTFVVPYEGGWAKNKDVQSGRDPIFKDFPPDRPPTEKYELWPSVYIPPYHYSDLSLDRQASIAAPAASDDPTVKALQASLTQLQKRIQKLRDVDALENLVSMYGYYLDKQQWDKLTDLFTADGSIEISRRGVYVGKASIRKSLELYGPQNIEPNHLHNHMQLHPVIHVSDDGQRAWVRCLAFSQLGTFGRSGAWMGGVYENEYAKENGVWKMKKDHVFTTFSAEYDKGWAFGARGAPMPSDKIPPDAPSTVIYEAFPKTFVPPYHYGHPVVGKDAEKVSAIKLPAAPKGNAELAAIRTQAQSIADRMLRLDDERAVVNLQRSYGFYVDKAKWREATDLFTDDGTLEIGGRGVFVGKKRVLQYYTWLSPNGLTDGLLYDHMSLQPIVTVSPKGDKANARFHFFATVGEHQKFGMWGLGSYENEYVKQNDVWKIKTLHGYFRMYSPYEKGWGKEANPMTRPEKDLPPDRPPTVVYDMYPATFMPAYHYKHPVTGK